MNDRSSVSHIIAGIAGAIITLLIVGLVWTPSIKVTTPAPSVKIVRVESDPATPKTYDPSTPPVTYQGADSSHPTAECATGLMPIDLMVNDTYSADGAKISAKSERDDYNNQEGVKLNIKTGPYTMIRAVIIKMSDQGMSAQALQIAVNGSHDTKILTSSVAADRDVEITSMTFCATRILVPTN